MTGFPDSPQGDYGSDRYDHVEARWRTAPPPQELVQRMLNYECPDCRVNLFIEEDAHVDGQYVVKIAHDETCPWLLAQEQDAGS